MLVMGFVNNQIVKLLFGHNAWLKDRDKEGDKMVTKKTCSNQYIGNVGLV